MKSMVQKRQIPITSPLRWTLVCAIAWLPVAGLQAEVSAKEIIKKVEENLRGKASVGEMLLVVQKDFVRKMLIQSWDDRAGDRFFLKIVKPQKDAGIRFLKDKGNMWQYLPRLGKEIQIEGSLMQNAWMGSDFSNDDLMKSSSLTDDYNHSFQKAAHADEWNIRLVPRPAAAVIWKHIDARIRQSDGMPLEYRFYDQQNRLKKLQEFSSFEVMGGRKIPTLMKMTTLIKGNVQSTTYLKFVRIEFREALDSAIFSKANLKR